MTDTASTTPAIRGFHAHVYFDANTVEHARTLCTPAADRLGAPMAPRHAPPATG